MTPDRIVHDPEEDVVWDNDLQWPDEIIDQDEDE